MYFITSRHKPSEREMKTVVEIAIICEKCVQLNVYLSLLLLQQIMQLAP